MTKNLIPEKAVDSTHSFLSVLCSVIATAALSLTVGYWLGSRNSLFLNRSSRTHGKREPGGNRACESSEDEEDVLDERQLPDEECKLVF